MQLLGDQTHIRNGDGQVAEPLSRQCPQERSRRLIFDLQTGPRQGLNELLLHFEQRQAKILLLRLTVRNHFVVLFAARDNQIFRFAQRLLGRSGVSFASHFVLIEIGITDGFLNGFGFCPQITSAFSSQDHRDGPEQIFDGFVI